MASRILISPGVSSPSTTGSHHMAVKLRTFPCVSSHLATLAELTVEFLLHALQREPLCRVIEMIMTLICSKTQNSFRSKWLWIRTLFKTEGNSTSKGIIELILTKLSVPLTQLSVLHPLVYENLLLMINI